MDKKKSFILYCDQYDPIKALTVEQKGSLLEALFEYQCEGTYEVKDPVVNMAFQFFKQTFDRDCVKYQEKCKKNRDNANKRWHATASSRNQMDAKHADSGSGSGSY